MEKIIKKFAKYNGAENCLRQSFHDLAVDINYENNSLGYRFLMDNKELVIDIIKKLI